MIIRYSLTTLKDHRMKTPKPHKYAALHPAVLRGTPSPKKRQKQKNQVDSSEYSDQASYSSPFVSVPLVCVQINDHDSLDVEPFEGKLDR
jgi:hypothetical protein